MDEVIRFENIGKLYKLGRVGTGTLSHDLNRWWHTAILRKEDPYLVIGETNHRDSKGESKYVWALEDINFSVKRGDVVGVIGQNGSGKSTLLKILSRITAPTTGVIKTKGRIASLLEIGTGFHPELTGRDNIYMNGSILGMTKREISSKLDEIVEFSGIERYIDTPVKRYSSGMTVRLGFAVAAFLEPEILLVDEVLAVGDAEFQKRAIGKMQHITTGEGRTVLFVSHNMNSVLQLCNRGLLLEDGKIAYSGDIHSVVSKYVGNLRGSTMFEGLDGNENILCVRRAVVSSDERSGNIFENTSSIKVEIEVEIKEKLKNLIVGFILMSQYDSPLARADYNDETLENTLPPGRYVFQFEIPPCTLAPGNYGIVFDVAHKRVKRFSTPKSNLYFEVVMGKQPFGNTFSIQRPFLHSLIHEKWIKGRECICSY